MADYPDELRELVDDYLGGLSFGDDRETAGLEEAMALLAVWRAASGSGRCCAWRRRARLGPIPHRVLPAAAAIELVHTYSLIHDDLPAMDDDDLRRGRPTSHKKFGEDVAILAGDGLFAEAINLFLSEQEGEPANVVAALRSLASATGVAGMVGGQYIDVAASVEDADGLRKLHGLKTGRLIAASVLVPLHLAGMPDDAAAPYRGFADELGVLFPDRRRHPRRDRLGRRARQAAGLR